MRDGVTGKKICRLCEMPIPEGCTICDICAGAERLKASFDYIARQQLGDSSTK